uniref:Uncharacterized protein n=1 Tax=Oryza glumipatula TaxID=40148 RepID=A0A0E0BL89_9ORYZ
MTGWVASAVIDLILVLQRLHRRKGSKGFAGIVSAREIFPHLLCKVHCVNGLTGEETSGEVRGINNRCNEKSATEERRKGGCSDIDKDTCDELCSIEDCCGEKNYGKECGKGDGDDLNLRIEAVRRGRAWSIATT